MTRLEEGSIERLPIDAWVSLIPSEDSALHYLFLPDIAPEIETEVVDDEPTSPTRILANLREDLSGLPVIEALEAGSATDEQPLEAAAADEDDSAMFSVAHDPPADNPLPSVPAATRVEIREEPDRVNDGVAGSPIIRLEPALEDDMLVPATPLVRHLRRQLARKNARILELEEEVRHLRTLRG